MEPNYISAEKLADSVLERFNIQEPLVPVFEIAKNEGLEIVFLIMPEKLKDVSGFFDPSTKKIYVNDEDPPNRKTFTVAHELGHYLLGHKPEQYGVLPRWTTVATTNIEKEANCFAGSLLVPKKMLLRVMEKYSLGKDDTVLLAKIFGVSREVIEYRLRRL